LRSGACARRSVAEADRSPPGFRSGPSIFEQDRSHVEVAVAGVDFESNPLGPITIDEEHAVSKDAMDQVDGRIANVDELDLVREQAA
jgi:hypothetical protein